MSKGKFEAARKPATLVEKIWREHAIAGLADNTDLLYIDRVFLHERSGGRMLKGLEDAGRPLADPGLVFGTLDHIIDTQLGRTDKTLFPGGADFISLFRERAAANGLPIFDLGDPYQGIVHVMAPELGLALPGLTFVCGDSHTCTLGGVGALAWGIGVTQGEHVLATQALPVKRPKQMRINCRGRLAPGVFAKDLILYLIGRYGAAAGAGSAVELAGPAIRSMDVSGRLTLCNMAVEFAAWTGIVAPDDTTLQYLAGRPYAPAGDLWDAAARHWRSLASDDDARFDTELEIDCGELAPQVTWGTSPEHVIPVDGRVPDPAAVADATQRSSMQKAQSYAELSPGTLLETVPVEAAFIGSCTNSRIEDLRAAAAILRGRKVHPGVTAICVPGSTQVRLQAEAEGLHTIFQSAGFDWREAGCSLCFYAGGDSFGTAKRVITSTNRNFENRQGPGVRSHLASPATVAASAVAGHIADPRALP